MQPKHVEYSRTIISVYVIFELASGTSVTAIGSWHDDKRRGWEFSVLVNIENRNLWDVKAGSGQYAHLEWAYEQLGVKITTAELIAIAKFLEDFKIKREPPAEYVY
jgi:hypothetical protein